MKHADGKTADYTLTRAKFNTNRPEELIPVDKDTARLVVYTFDLSYDETNVESLLKEAAKYKNLVVDLRDNGGGAVVNVQTPARPSRAAHTAFGTFVDRSMVNDYVRDTGGKENEVAKIAEWSARQRRTGEASR